MVGVKRARPTAKALANLRPFKKGECHNPLGVNANPVKLRLRTLAAPEIAEVGSLILDNNVATLKKIVDESYEAKGSKTKFHEESKHSALKVWMANVALRGIVQGDPYALDSLLNRIIGKVPNRLEPPGPGGVGLPAPDVPAMSSQDRQAEIAHYQNLLAGSLAEGIEKAVAKDAETKENEEAIEVESRVIEPDAE